MHKLYTHITVTASQVCTQLSIAIWSKGKIQLTSELRYESADFRESLIVDFTVHRHCEFSWYMNQCGSQSSTPTPISLFVTVSLFNVGANL